jgi:phosphatidyl-myo-inositol alpha-mannosyltransferase
MVVPYDLAEEGGVKRHAMQLATSLRALGDEVDVIGPFSRRGPALPEHTYGFSGVVNIPANGSDNYLGIFVQPWKVWRHMRRRKYDVLHVHEPLQPSINYYAAWSVGRQAARVGTFHSFMETESTRLRLARKFWGLIAFPSYDRGIAVSPAAAETARVAFKKQLAIIPNGIRPDLYRAGGPPTKGPLKLLFVGHWRDSRKGLPVLLEACAALHARGVAFTLDIVGEGSQQAKSDLPGLTYHGPISGEGKVAEMYAACDVFVAPSLGGESFGIVLLEAMAAARPIVCSDIPGYRFAVGEGPGSGARLVAPGDVSGLVREIEALANAPELRAEMGAVNHKRVRQFGWDNLVAQVREQYVAALASRGRTVDGAENQSVAAV